MRTFDRERIKLPQEPQFAFSGKSTFWFENKKDIAEDEKLFDENEFQMPTKLQILDIPSKTNIFNKHPEYGLSIFTALRLTDQTEIFESEAIRAIIEYAWPVARQSIIRWMMIPSIIFLLFFIAFTAIIFSMTEDCKAKFITDELICNANEIINMSSKVIILIFLLYFLLIEIRQAFIDVQIYFSSPWNYLDLIAIFFVLFTVTLDFMNNYIFFERPLFAFATLIIWMRTLYYLRIFRNVGYLTSMII